MMGLGVVLRRQVTLLAQRIAFGAQLLGMRIVAVAARHAFGEHAAVQERAVIEHLVLHLAVGPVQPALQEADAEAVGERLAGMDIVGWPAATIVRGKIVMRDDEVQGEPTGKLVQFRG